MPPKKPIYKKKAAVVRAAPRQWNVEEETTRLIRIRAERDNLFQGTFLPLALAWSRVADEFNQPFENGMIKWTSVINRRLEPYFMVYI